MIKLIIEYPSPVTHFDKPSGTLAPIVMKQRSIECRSPQTFPEVALGPVPRKIECVDLYMYIIKNMPLKMRLAENKI